MHCYIPVGTYLTFLYLRIKWSGQIVFILSICLSVVNFNIHYNFLTIGDRYFLYTITHTNMHHTNENKQSQIKFNM